MKSKFAVWSADPLAKAKGAVCAELSSVSLSPYAV